MIHLSNEYEYREGYELFHPMTEAPFCIECMYNVLNSTTSTKCNSEYHLGFFEAYMDWCQAVNPFFRPGHEHYTEEYRNDS